MPSLQNQMPRTDLALPFMERRPSWDAEEAMRNLRRSAGVQLFGVREDATDPKSRDRIFSTAIYLNERLAILTELAGSNQIRPFRDLVLEEGGGPVPIEEPTLRVGVYPVAANPLHWGHVLVGLTVMASMKLDKVVFVIAGRDGRKPSMLAPDARHRLARSVIEAFSPVFAYSSLALGTDYDGEANFGRLLRLNAHRPMEAFYIAGADHYRRWNALGEPDTIEKLEKVVEEQEKADGSFHAVTVVFLDRAGVERQGEEVRTSLNVAFLPTLPFSFSSTAARLALRNGAFSEALAILPYSCLIGIRANGFYSDDGEWTQGAESSA